MYEEGIDEICKIIHDNGGQVYMDGANMNAQVRVMASSDLITSDIDSYSECIDSRFWVCSSGRFNKPGLDRS